MLDKFGFETQIARLDSANLLYLVLSQFHEFDPHPDVVSVTFSARTERASTWNTSRRCGSVTPARTVTLRLSDDVYEAVRRYAEADQQSMNSWVEGVLDVEDMRRRCVAHDRWMTAHPDAISFAEAWADRNLDELTRG